MNDNNSSRSKAWLYNPTYRNIFYQAVVIGGLFWFLYSVTGNVIANLEARGISTGLGFLNQRAGFAIAQSLIEYDAGDTYGRTFLVGLLNTVLVSVMGIVSATLLGLFIGVSRLSPNWLLRKICMVYIETFRNIPLLLQIFFWYFAVLRSLPGARDAINFGTDSFFLSIRGFYGPKPIPEPGFGIYVGLIVLSVIAVVILARWAKARFIATGEQFPVLWTSVAIIIGTLVLGFFVTGRPISFELPVLRGFNFAGGLRIIPELLALWFALTIYTSTYIAEIVRSGIEAVAHGQTEACRALGLNEKQRLNLVVLPQAMRVMIPPMTSQYLNLAKNSSLAVAIGYPDLVAVFMGTTLNQTGQAVEIVAMTMLVYLTISLTVSAFMNWFNKRVALVER